MHCRQNVKSPERLEWRIVQRLLRNLCSDWLLFASPVDLGFNRRTIFDSTTVVSTLIFGKGRLSWLVRHWEHGGCTPLVSTLTAGN
jgi:Flp pilus assembly CpaE family ATPase